MKNLKSYISAFTAMLALTFGTSSCQDHFDEVSGDIDVPVATMQANTTLAELKALLWQADNNYCNQVYTKEWYATPEADRTDDLKTNGTHIIIKGRVASSDYAGNVFKYIVLQDEDGTCLNFSINSYNLYMTYRRGQEVVIDMTGMYAGKYRGLFQVGFPSYNKSIPGYETSFLAPEMFVRMRELNGAPDVAKVDTVVLDNFSYLGVTDAELQYWQSRIVRFNNVAFVNPSTESPDVETLSTYHENVTQQITDVNGNVLDVRTSGYCNFWNTKMPEGRGDVVAILGYYVNLANNGGWQLTLLDINSLQNFGNPTVGPGSESNPYTVEQAITTITNGESVTGWVRGYIVGTVAPEVTTVSSASDIQFTATPDLGNTLVIGQTPESNTLDQLLVITLPQGSDLRKYGALRENPANYKKQIDIRGTFGTVMGTNGITGNNGSSSEFKIEGLVIGGGDVIPAGDGTKESPYNCSQVIALNPPSKDTPLETGKWVKGYIVGVYNFDNKASQWEFSGDVTINTNLVLADSPDVTSDSRIVAVKLSAGTVRDALNLVANPGNYKKAVAVYGDVQKYCGKPGMQNVTDYILDGQQGGDTPNPPAGDGLTLLGASDANGFNGWAIDNIKLATGISNVWTWAEYNGAHYANATAFKGVGDTESWLVSPVLDFTKVTSASAVFDHAAKFQTTLRTLCGLYARTEGASSWTALTIPTWPEAGAWTFVSSGSIDLSAYAGKKMQLAFLYRGSDAGSDQWEIRDLVLSGNGGSITVAGSATPSTGGGTGGDKPGTGGDKPSDQGGTQGVFNFADPTTLNPAYSEKDQVADGTTGNFKIDVNDVKFTSASASISNGGSGTAARLYHQSKGDWTYRFYKNTTTTIAVAEGYHITKIEFTAQTTGYATAVGNATYSSGKIDGTTWTPTSDVSSVTMTPAATIGLTKVVVTYSK